MLLRKGLWSRSCLKEWKLQDSLVSNLLDSGKDNAVHELFVVEALAARTDLLSRTCLKGRVLQESLVSNLADKMPLMQVSVGQISVMCCYYGTT